MQYTSALNGRMGRLYHETGKDLYKSHPLRRHLIFPPASQVNLSINLKPATLPTIFLIG